MRASLLPGISGAELPPVDGGTEWPDLLAEGYVPDAVNLKFKKELARQIRIYADILQRTETIASRPAWIALSESLPGMKIAVPRLNGAVKLDVIDGEILEIASQNRVIYLDLGKTADSGRSFMAGEVDSDEKGAGWRYVSDLRILRHILTHHTSVSRFERETIMREAEKVIKNGVPKDQFGQDEPKETLPPPKKFSFSGSSDKAVLYLSANLDNAALLPIYETDLPKP